MSIYVHAVRVFLLSVCLSLAGVAGGCKPSPRPGSTPKVAGETPADRPAHWARPIEGRSGLSNLFQVDQALYRGAQPEDAGFAELRDMGIRTVVNLRTLHSDRKECQRAGLDYVHITMQAWEGEDEEVIEFLQVVTEEARQPVFVHCQHGADRTGTMCAVYRLVVQGWTKEDAIDEMTNGGFGFHSVWQNLVSYVRQLDVEHLRQKSGVAG